MTYTTLIDATSLHELIEQQSVLVFDCEFDLTDPDAGRATYLAGHLPGARYLHLGVDLSAPSGAKGRHPLPDPAVFAATLRERGLRHGQQVVAYDSAGGPYATRLWWMLRWIGHEAVAVLDGGKSAWTVAGYPLETGDIGGGTGDFTLGQADASRVAEVGDVVANLATQDRLVLDARAPERFAGQPSPLDPVSGHIPGARNRFYKDNLGADGRFRSPEELATAFGEVLATAEPANVILQCGSGVTACHNALAMEIAGLAGAKLYPGSWSEWILDPARPVETAAGR